MSKRGAAIAGVFCLVGIGAAIAVTAPDKIDVLRGVIGMAGANAQASTQPSDKPAERRWLAVAPGRVEPPSGMIKVAAPTMGVVSKVLVKVNDTVFAGEPLVLLNDDEIQSRYLAAESQAGMRKRLRDEQPATGKALERRKIEDAVADGGLHIGRRHGRSALGQGVLGVVENPHAQACALQGGDEGVQGAVAGGGQVLLLPAVDQGDGEGGVLVVTGGGQGGPAQLEAAPAAELGLGGGRGGQVLVGEDRPQAVAVDLARSPSGTAKRFAQTLFSGATRREIDDPDKQDRKMFARAMRDLTSETAAEAKAAGYRTGGGLRPTLGYVAAAILALAVLAADRIENRPGVAA